MKTMVIPLTITIAVTFTLSNTLADDGQVSNLKFFGLSGLQVLSDTEGLEVRGMGKKKTKSYAFTAGKSKANVNGNKKKDSHFDFTYNPNGPSWSSGGSGAVSIGYNGGFSIGGTVGGAKAGAF